MSDRLLALSIAATTHSAGPRRKPRRPGRALSFALLALAGLGLLTLMVKAPI